MPKHEEETIHFEFDLNDLLMKAEVIADHIHTVSDNVPEQLGILTCAVGAYILSNAKKGHVEPATEGFCEQLKLVVKQLGEHGKPVLVPKSTAKH